MEEMSEIKETYFTPHTPPFLHFCVLAQGQTAQNKTSAAHFANKNKRRVDKNGF